MRPGGVRYIDVRPVPAVVDAAGEGGRGERDVLRPDSLLAFEFLGCHTHALGSSSSSVSLLTQGSAMERLCVPRCRLDILSCPFLSRFVWGMQASRE